MFISWECFILATAAISQLRMAHHMLKNILHTTHGQIQNELKQLDKSLEGSKKSKFSMKNEKQKIRKVSDVERKVKIFDEELKTKAPKKSPTGSKKVKIFDDEWKQKL